jgi:(1->4)-alpha-D-glucan 1-alpha-D-glucosylmutase
MNLPTATYRIQLHADFGFRATADLLDYLHALGVSHLYASPAFKARKGSAHGYDIEDPNQLNPELGDQASCDYFFQRLKALQMGWIQDIVPNHMAYSGGNPLLSDVLENGSRSLFHEFFDIQWEHPAPELNGAVSAPFLGESLDICLGRGDIGLYLTAEGLHAGYYGHRFPLTLDAYASVLCSGGECSTENAVDTQAEKELRSRVDGLMQSARLCDPQARQQALAEAKQSVWSLYSGDERIKAIVDSRLRRLNKTPFEAGLDDLLAHQNFRLCHWATAARQINYRRFFDINELIALRQELPAVFNFTHQLIERLAGDGLISGLRIDHIDGLFDPAGYLERLRRSLGDIYIVAEKILGPDEPLPETWAVQGTTGYEFAAQMSALFCCPDHEAEMTRLYQNMTGNEATFAQIGRQSKRQVLVDQFSGDLDNLVAKWEAAMQTGSDRPPLRRAELRAALTEMLIGLPVYRTYLASFEGSRDQAVMQRLLAEAETRRPDLAVALASIRDWLALTEMPRPTLTGKWITSRQRQNALAAFEQLGAPLTAKGIEDTALYRYTRLAALNEVGGDPERFGASPQAFHQFAAGRQQQWPYSLSALSTHDTKRSADVRARMLVIAEMPGEWGAQLERWRQCNAAAMGRTDGGPVPDPEMEYLLYQTLAATLPADRAHLPAYRPRIASFLIKSAKEAKRRTSWIAPAQDYEQALRVFVERILDPDHPFIDLIMPFAARIAHFGFFNALSQALIHLTAPGIPDIYQGTELFDDSLVDPDNRRPVDFEWRRRCLSEIEKGYHNAPLALAQNLMARRHDGTIKLFLTWIGLQTRRRHADLFLNGQFVPLVASGVKARHAVAFARVSGPRWCLTIVPRFPVTLAAEGHDPLGPGVWSDTTVHLPAQAPPRWHDLMTNAPLQAMKALPLGQVFKHLPVALLMGEN